NSNQFRPQARLLRGFQSALLPTRLSPAPIRRAPSLCGAGLRRAPDVLSAGLRADAGRGSGPAVPDRGSVPPRALRAPWRRNPDAVSVGVDPEPAAAPAASGGCSAVRSGSLARDAKRVDQSLVDLGREGGWFAWGSTPGAA